MTSRGYKQSAGGVMRELYFSQVREDSQIEILLLGRHPSQRIAAVGSGGCTVLSILGACGDEVERVYAVDANPAQCALLELRSKAIVTLDREAYLEFIGEDDSPNRTEVYSCIEPELSEWSQEFWRQRIDAIELGINRAGSMEQFFDFVFGQIRCQTHPDDVWRALFECPSIEAQRCFYRDHFDTPEWRSAILALLDPQIYGRFFPNASFDSQVDGETFGERFLRHFERALCSSRIADNYFLSQLVWGRYREGASGAPFYLTPQGYDSVRRNIYKLEVCWDSLQRVLPELEDVGSFFVSNVFDWATPLGRQMICRGLLRAATRGALLLYRSIESSPAMPEDFTARFLVDEDLSQQLGQLERSMLYCSLTAGVLT